MKQILHKFISNSMPSLEAIFIPRHFLILCNIEGMKDL
jgi:hypothetical protein